MTDAERGQVAETAAEIYEDFFVPALFSQWPHHILDAARVRTGDRVLDVGCGTGILARSAVGRVGPECRVVGLDPNRGMLTVARRQEPSVEWREGAAEAIPYTDNSFDRVVSQFAAMFFADRAAAFAEMARVCAPGGRVVVATWSSLEATPGYAAMVELLDRLFGTEAANALRTPFVLGDADELAASMAPAVERVEVASVEGVARFESIDAWVHTDIRGWTLADMIDEDEFQLLLTEARRSLARFTDSAGRVTFPAPALIATAS